jgi:hypothetical protein
VNTVVQIQPATATFEDFWRVYPKKVQKPLAKAKWDSIVNGGLKTRTLDKDSGSYIEIELSATPQEIVEAARKYAVTQIDRDNGYKLRDGGRYTCNPATWLNQGRWEDLV